MFANNNHLENEQSRVKMSLKDRSQMAETQRQYAEKVFKMGKYFLARHYYTEAIALCPKVAIYYEGRAACNIAIKNFSEALQDTRHALKLDPKLTKPWLYVFKCSLLIGDHEGAKTALQKISQLDSTLRTVKEWSKLKRLMELQDTIATFANKYKFRGKTLLYYIDEVRHLAPKCVKYRILEGECLAFVGHFDRAMHIADQCLRRNPNSGEAIYLRGLCHYLMQNLDDASNQINLALEIEPNHRLAHIVHKKCYYLEKGGRYASAGRHLDAVNAFNMGVSFDGEINELNVPLYQGLALCNAKLGHYREAIDDCSLILLVKHKHLRALLLRAKCFGQMKMFDKCVADYERAFKIHQTKEIEELLRAAKLEQGIIPNKDHYDTLGVKRNAKKDEIKKAYRKKALMHHPDKHSACSEEKRQIEEENFKKVVAAYNVLSDPTKRAQYDFEEACKI